MVVATLDPRMNSLRLDQSSTMRAHRYADRFSVVRAWRRSGPLVDAVRKTRGRWRREHAR
jgi:hypothetical protein